MRVPFRYKAVYDRLPEAEKELPICIMDKKKYSWKQVYQELEKDTELGKKMLCRLIIFGFIHTMSEWMAICREKGICHHCGEDLLCSTCDADEVIEAAKDWAQARGEDKRDAYG